MSAKQTTLDRKARRALMLVGIMLLLVIALALWNLSARLAENNAPSPPSNDERLVVIDKQRMVIGPQALGNTMADWLRAGDEKTLSFELSDRSFRPNSAAPSGLTMMRVGQVAALAKASPTLTIHILEPIGVASTASRQLDEQRAARLRQELVAGGVTESHVTIENEQSDLPFAKSPYLAVLLAK